MVHSGRVECSFGWLIARRCEGAQCGEEEERAPMLHMEERGRLPWEEQ